MQSVVVVHTQGFGRIQCHRVRGIAGNECSTVLPKTARFVPLSILAEECKHVNEKWKTVYRFYF